MKPGKPAKPAKPTADLYDAHEGEVQVADALLADYGGARAFAGEVATVACFEDNSLVRERLAEPGRGRVLVVDGGGSRSRALLGDRLAALAVENGWSGVVVHGCIRDSVAVAGMALGVKALGTSPRRSVKRGAGESDVAVTFAGVTFEPGQHLYADEDGILVAPREL